MTWTLIKKNNFPERTASLKRVFGRLQSFEGARDGVTF